MVTPRRHPAAHLTLSISSFFPALSHVCLYYRPALRRGFHRGAPPSNGFLTHSLVAEGGGAARGGCTGCVDSGVMGREGGEGGCILASDTEALSLFFPSFLWFYGLLTGSRLSSGYERGSLADLLQRF